MRKITAVKLLLALTLGTASVLGMFHVAAQPAQALNCPSQRLGCGFIGICDVPGGICCAYQCPNGQMLEGPCEQSL
ncbi:MAG TPA: hypothetical protein VF789_28850 [Thermoanaerobaculia bacterium]